MAVKIKLLSEGAKLPKRIENGAAGYDLYAPKDVIVKEGRNLIPLDFQMELEPGMVATIRPRSGFSLKGVEGHSLSCPSANVRYDADVLIGTIDESYRGSVGVILKNYESCSFVIPKGTRIAQMIISKYYGENLELTETMSETERGAGGFGHTGAK